MGDIRLVVQADDLGMCRAVNEGVAQATIDGILTQTSAMAPTPWVNEGIRVAKRLGLGIGMHVTMTCEWDHYRWAPLSPGASLRGDDGTFHRTIQEVTEKAEPAELLAEAHAQADRLVAAGVEVTYVDPHMGVNPKGAHEAMCERFGVKFDYKQVEPHHVWDTLIVLSIAPVEDRPAWFADRLDRLGPGTHFVMTHPATDTAELRSLTAEDNDNWDWAVPYRLADLAALCAPDVRAVIERKGIELVAAKDL